MAGGSLLALLDDITLILDDVSVMTKVAAQKTAGVLGDDLALNAQQVAGVNADRELPVVWAVAKGSLVNKLILVPLALLLGAFAPAWVLTALLMVGGAYLCFEGFEKIAHALLHSKQEDQKHHDELIHAIEDETVDMLQFERDKIRGAVRTDFVLSAEIIAITLGVVAAEPFLTQATVLSGIALIMTVGVYGLVAGIVKLDDLGFYLCAKASSLAQKIGAGLLWFTPHMMRGLSIVGTVAMFTVGGGIITHGVPVLHHFSEALNPLTSTLFNAAFGLLVGGLVVLAVLVMQKVKRK
ncbi:MAG: DUF808 domain-containing protein [Formosimonas sp.]